MQSWGTLNPDMMMRCAGVHRCRDADDADGRRAGFCVPAMYLAQAFERIN
jgi:hypothetical protein